MRMFTEDGFLVDWTAWTEDLAIEIAARHDIVLTAEHWTVIQFVRDFYATYQTTPPIRVLVKTLKETYGPEVGNSVYLQRLFPPSAAKEIARIAGLPKPKKCI